MPAAIEREPYETFLVVKNYVGRNSYGEHSSLSPAESREMINWDLVNSKTPKSRRGSQWLRPGSPTPYSSTDIKDGVTWDIGDEEYLITQIGLEFYSQALLTPANPVKIDTFTAASFAVSTSEPADMFVRGDRLFVFHETGNKIIEWDSSSEIFKGRDMGMDFPYFWSILTSSAGSITGRYVYGLEKVYRVNDSDVLVSSPNRKMASTRILCTTGTITSKKATLTIQAAALDSDALWTHLRLWRSKNINAEMIGDEVVDAVGLAGELYENALITRAEIEGAGLNSISTSSSLPKGNANVKAGVVTATYTIEDNNGDEYLGEAIDIDRIELIPMPNAAIGCYHKKRIWASRINQADVDFSDDSRDKIFFSNLHGTKYSELCDPLNFIETGNDGQQMIKLMSFEKDLLGIKESRTGRLPDGNINMQFEEIDGRIGISHKRMAQFVPNLGVAAITNDDGMFSYLGYDLLWHKQLNSLGLAKPIQVETAAMTAAGASFVYLNGKLFISDGTGNCYVLHKEVGLGWTTYAYRMNSTAQLLFTFANGSRAAIASKSTYLVEIDIDDLNTDIDTADETAYNISLSHTTYKFQLHDGADILEQLYYAIRGKFSSAISATLYLNGVTWPDPALATTTHFVVDPNANASNAPLQEKEYRLYIEPKKLNTMNYCPPQGNFIHYTVTTEAPAVMHSQILKAEVEEDAGYGDFDPYQKTNFASAFPSWASQTILVLTFDETSGDKAYDVSGNNRHHEFNVT